MGTITLEFFAISLLNALSYGLLLFMLSAGLTLIFSMMGVLNFAHASFYMLGAYVAYSTSQVVGFWWSLLLAPLLVFGLCRSLMGAPELIIIDEPTEGLAPQIVAQVSSYLQTLRASGMAVLLIEQKLTMAMAISDRVLVMGHGRTLGSQATVDAWRDHCTGAG